MAKDLTLLLIIALPFIGFAINGLFGKKLPKTLVGGLATGVVFAAFILATTLFSGLHGTQIVKLFNIIGCCFGFPEFFNFFFDQLLIEFS
jgi:NADH-quinone oxidoreductase subunit L